MPSGVPFPREVNPWGRALLHGSDYFVLSCTAIRTNLEANRPDSSPVYVTGIFPVFACLRLSTPPRELKPDVAKLISGS